MALDPGENGIHGPWMVELADGEFTQPKQIPLSRMRYESVELSASVVTDINDFDTWIIRALREKTLELLEGHDALRCLSLRVSLIGRTPVHGLLPDRVSRLMDELDLTVGDATVSIDKVECNTALTAPS